MAITKQDVFDAAAAISTRGGKPTLNDIRNELGGGGFTTINDALTEGAQSKRLQWSPSQRRSENRHLNRFPID